MTTLAKRDPFVGGLFRDFDNIFDGVFNGRRRLPLSIVTSPIWYEHAHGVAGRSVRETDDGFEITIDVPGFSREDLSVYVQDDVLHIEGKIGDEETTRSVRRSYSLTEICDQDSLSAECKNGVLTVTVPKKVVVEKEPDRLEVEIT